MATTTRQHDRPTTTRRKRAVSYLRVSSAGQVNTDYDPEGISLPAQRAAIQRRAIELDTDIIAEFVEPGRSATSIDKRPAFQDMMARIKAERDIDYVLVYARSRLHRNAIDAAITKRDLREFNVTIVSITDYTEDNAIGDLVATVLDAVNEYQSRASGADIAYKMGQKVARGGSIGSAPLGYLNVRERFEGREVRTVAVDPERGPLIRVAFELYATGTHTLRSLLQTLTDAGLRTRPRRDRPAGRPISLHKLGDLLRDRYYLGYVRHRGQECPGRHEPLVTPELFERVQQTLGANGGGTRHRTHHHYLKGTIWCHRCRGRLVIMRGKSKTGELYFYYFCLGRQRHTCDLPYLPVSDVEAAVAANYAAITLSPETRSRVSERITSALDQATRLDTELRQRVGKRIAVLDDQEDRILDLVGDPDWPQEKLAARMRAIRDERAELARRLDDATTSKITTTSETLAYLLDLLANPRDLYERASKRAKRVLNQAFFTRIYLDADKEGPLVTHDEPTETLAPLIEFAKQASAKVAATPADHEDRTADQPQTALLDGCSSNTKMVGRRYHHANQPATIAGDVLPLRLRRSTR